METANSVALLKIPRSTKTVVPNYYVLIIMKTLRLCIDAVCQFVTAFSVWIQTLIVVSHFKSIWILSAVEGSKLIEWSGLGIIISAIQSCCCKGTSYAEITCVRLFIANQFHVVCVIFCFLMAAIVWVSIHLLQSISFYIDVTMIVFLCAPMSALFVKLVPLLVCMWEVLGYKCGYLSLTVLTKWSNGRLTML